MLYCSVHSRMFQVYVLLKEGEQGVVSVQLALITKKVVMVMGKRKGTNEKKSCLLFMRVLRS